MLQDRFRISQSYYVPMEHRQVKDLLDTYLTPDADQSKARTPGRWHADDMLLTPLRGSGDRILGVFWWMSRWAARIPGGPRLKHWSCSPIKRPSPWRIHDYTPTCNSGSIT